MHPTFIQFPEKLLVGLGTRFISILSPNKNMNTIPQLWHQFIHRLPEIPHRLGTTTYGLIEEIPETTPKSDPAELFYIAAAEVSHFADLPHGMLTRTLRTGRYASFTHKGKLDHLENTASFIYRTWLPSSGIKLRNAPHIEIYDHPRFNPESDQSELDILIPVH